MDPQLTEFLWSASLRIPILLVTLIGIVWALVSWKKAPSGALLAIAACSLLFLFSCIFPALLVWIPDMVRRNAQGGDIGTRMAWTFRSIIASWNVCTAVCLLALIVAVFSGRSAIRSDPESDRRPTGREDDERDLDERIKSV